MDKEDDLRFELKAWQLTRQKVGQKIRKKVWDDMDVKGRSINGMQVSKNCLNNKFSSFTKSFLVHNNMFLEKYCEIDFFKN